MHLGGNFHLRLRTMSDRHCVSGECVSGKETEKESASTIPRSFSTSTFKGIRNSYRGNASGLVRQNSLWTRTSRSRRSLQLLLIGAKGNQWAVNGGFRQQSQLSLQSGKALSSRLRLPGRTRRPCIPSSLYTASELTRISVVRKVERHSDTPEVVFSALVSLQ